MKNLLLLLGPAAISLLENYPRSSPFVNCPHTEASRASFSSLGRARPQEVPRVTTSAPAGGPCLQPHHLQVLAAAGEAISAAARLLLTLRLPFLVLLRLL